jgi:Tol biopolymer transport system component
LPTASPTASPSPTPTATPTPALVRLTEGGCCFAPFYLDNRVTFIDRPAPDAQVGYYAVPPNGSAPELVEERLGMFHGGGAYFSYFEGRQTILERRADGQRWTLNTNAQPIVLSPDVDEISWAQRQFEGPFDRRRSDLWRVSLETGQAVRVTSLFGGGLAAWLPGDRWLLQGRRNVGEQDRTLFVLNLADGSSRDLFQAQQLRSLSVSPDGAWVAFLVAFHTDPARNGMWLVRTDGSEQRQLDWFGAYAWRDGGSLVYLPFQPGAASHEVWLYEVEKGASRRLIDATTAPIKIAQGDFTLAPDGRTLVFVAAADLNLWALRLPE